VVQPPVIKPLIKPVIKPVSKPAITSPVIPPPAQATRPDVIPYAAPPPATGLFSSTRITDRQRQLELLR
jgi:hypothetical protein